MSRPFIHSVADLSAETIRDAVCLAQRFERVGSLRSSLAPRAPFTVGLLFLAPSLRSRVGFASAAIRLGGTPIEVRELRRTTEMNAAESFEDTLRVLSGMVDVTVVRTPFETDRATIEALVASPYVNAGDGAANHPTQALIDLYAIGRTQGSPENLRLGLCGDLTSRSARSLIALLGIISPLSIRLIAPDGYDEVAVPAGTELEQRTVRCSKPDFTDLDVLYMCGLDGGVPTSTREAFALTAERLAELPAEASILAPMPIIDEVSVDVRRDPRFKAFDQSDWGVYVRMAVLDACRSRRGLPR